MDMRSSALYNLCAFGCVPKRLLCTWVCPAFYRNEKLIRWRVSMFLRHENDGSMLIEMLMCSKWRYLSACILHWRLWEKNWLNHHKVAFIYGIFSYPWCWELLYRWNHGVNNSMLCLIICFVIRTQNSLSRKAQNTFVCFWRIIFEFSEWNIILDC